MNADEKKYLIRGQEYSYSDAKTYIENYDKGISKPTSRYSLALKFIPVNSLVLDYGCGWGLFSRMISLERTCSVIAIDIDASAIEIAADIVGEDERLTFSTASIADIADSSHEVVTSMQVLEHTHNPGNYLAHCNRVMKPHGWLVISVPNIMNPRFLLPQLSPNQKRRYERISAAVALDYDKAHEHVHAWDPATFCRLLGTMGFEYKAHEFAEGIPLPKGKYWRTNVPGLRNLSYTMIFAAQKTRDVEIGQLE